MISLRARTVLPVLTIAEEPDQNTFRLAVEKERRLELAFEGRRRFDLVRINRAIVVMAGVGYNISQDQLLLPIPQAAFDGNPNL